MAQTSKVRGRATSVRENDGVTVVRYHGTDVVAFDKNRIVLNTGGYRTYTTKLRMNQAAAQFDLGYRVYQKNHDWFVDYRGNVTRMDRDCISFNR